MLVSSVLTFLSVPAFSTSMFAHGAPVSNLVGTISCSNSFNTNWHLTQHSAKSQNDFPAGFVSIQNSKGHLELTTSVNGVPTSSNQNIFTFYTCKSEVMPSQTRQLDNGATRYYGQLRPAGQPTNCVTFPSNNSAPSQYKPLTNVACQTGDDSSLIKSWFSLDIGTSQPDLLRIVGYPKGVNGSSLPPVVFNNLAIGNAHVLQAAYRNTPTDYTLQLTQA